MQVDFLINRTGKIQFLNSFILNPTKIMPSKQILLTFNKNWVKIFNFTFMYDHF